MAETAFDLEVGIKDIYVLERKLEEAKRNIGPAMEAGFDAFGEVVAKRARDMAPRDADGIRSAASLAFGPLHKNTIHRATEDYVDIVAPGYARFVNGGEYILDALDRSKDRAMKAFGAAAMDELGFTTATPEAQKERREILRAEPASFGSQVRRSMMEAVVVGTAWRWARGSPWARRKGGEIKQKLSDRGLWVHRTTTVGLMAPPAVRTGGRWQDWGAVSRKAPETEEWVSQGWLRGSKATGFEGRIGRTGTFPGVWGTEEQGAVFPKGFGTRRYWAREWMRGYTEAPPRAIGILQSGWVKQKPLMLHTWARRLSLRGGHTARSAAYQFRRFANMAGPDWWKKPAPRPRPILWNRPRFGGLADTFDISRGGSADKARFIDRNVLTGRTRVSSGTIWLLNRMGRRGRQAANRVRRRNMEAMQRTFNDNRTRLVGTMDPRKVRLFDARDKRWQAMRERAPWMPSRLADKLRPKSPSPRGGMWDRQSGRVPWFAARQQAWEDLLKRTPEVRITTVFSRKGPQIREPYDGVVIRMRGRRMPDLRHTGAGERDWLRSQWAKNRWSAARSRASTAIGGVTRPARKANRAALRSRMGSALWANRRRAPVDAIRAAGAPGAGVQRRVTPPQPRAMWRGWADRIVQEGRWAADAVRRGRMPARDLPGKRVWRENLRLGRQRWESVNREELVTLGPPGALRRTRSGRVSLPVILPGRKWFNVQVEAFRARPAAQWLGKRRAATDVGAPAASGRWQRWIEKPPEGVPGPMREVFERYRDRLRFELPGITENRPTTIVFARAPSPPGYYAAENIRAGKSAIILRQEREPLSAMWFTKGGAAEQMLRALTPSGRARDRLEARFARRYDLPQPLFPWAKKPGPAHRIKTRIMDALPDDTLRSVFDYGARARATAQALRRGDLPAAANLWDDVDLAQNTAATLRRAAAGTRTGSGAVWRTARTGYRAGAQTAATGYRTASKAAVTGYRAGASTILQGAVGVYRVGIQPVTVLAVRSGSAIKARYLRRREPQTAWTTRMRERSRFPRFTRPNKEWQGQMVTEDPIPPIPEDSHGIGVIGWIRRARRRG